jgi:hypothetical protein
MASNGRPHRLKPRRGKSECRMLLFAPALDPPIIAYPAHFTCRNGQVSYDLPIIHTQILHNRSLAHVGDLRRRFAGHFFFAFLAGFSPVSFERICRPPRSYSINDSAKLAPLNPAAFWPARRVVSLGTASRAGPLRICSSQSKSSLTSAPRWGLTPDRRIGAPDPTV